MSESWSGCCCWLWCPLGGELPPPKPPPMLMRVFGSLLAGYSVGTEPFFSLSVCENRTRASQVAKPRVQRQNPRRKGKKNKKKIDYIPSYFWVSPCTTRRAAAHYRFVFFGGPAVARLPETEILRQAMTQVEPPRIFSRFNSPPHITNSSRSRNQSGNPTVRAGRVMTVNQLCPSRGLWCHVDFGGDDSDGWWSRKENAQTP